MKYTILSILTMSLLAAQSLVVQAQDPTVTSIVPATAGPTNADDLDFNVTFSEAITGFVSGDVIVNHSGTAHTNVSVMGSGINWTVTVEGVSGDGSLTVTVPANANSSAQDLDGNSISGSLTSSAVIVDNTGISVVSITDDVASLTNATQVRFVITLDERPPSRFLDPRDILLNLNGVSAASSNFVGVGASSYQYTVNGISGNGTMSVTVPGSHPSFTRDEAGNPIPNELTSDVITIDQTPPNVSSITLQGPASTNASSVSFDVVFDDTVTGFAPGDVTFTPTGSVASTGISIAGSGTDYVVTVNGISGDGTFNITVPADSNSAAQDAAGNSIGSGLTSSTVTIDNTAPTVSQIALQGPASTNAESITFDVTFNEPVTGFDSTDVLFTPTGSVVSTGLEVTGSDANYVVTVNGVSGDGTFTVTVPDVNSAIIDAVGNPIANSLTSLVVTVDNTAPTVSSIVLQGANPTNADNIAFDVTFSEAMFGFDSTDVLFTPTGSVANTGMSINGSGANWVVTINGVSGDGTFTITVPADSTSTAKDAGGNSITGNLTSSTVIVSNTAPTVSQIALQGNSLTNASSISFDVIFSKAVTGFVPGDVLFTPTGSVVNTGIAVNGSGVNWTVTVNGVSGDGTFTITVPANMNSSAEDNVGNSVVGSVTSSVVTVDQTAPAVNQVALQGRSPTNASSISFDVTFDEAVIGFAPGDVTFTPTGSVASTAIAVNGSGVNWTVTVNGVSGDGTFTITVPAHSTSAGKDAAGNSITGSVTSSVVTVDNTAPTVSSIVLQGVSPTSASGILFDVTFSEAISGFDPADVTFTPTGSVVSTGVAVNGSGANWGVSVNGVSGDGTFTITVPANSNSAGKDVVGNSISGSLTSSSVTVDQTAPTVVSITPDDAPDAQGDYTFTVVFSEAITGFDSSADLDLTLNNLTALPFDFQTSDNVTHTFKLNGDVAEGFNSGTASVSVNLLSDVTDPAGLSLTTPNPTSSTVLFFRGGLVLHWDTEEGSGNFTTEQRSGKADVAQFVNGPTWTTGLAPGSSHAVDFSSTTPVSFVDAGSMLADGQYVSGQPDSTFITDFWSIAGWIQVDSLPNNFPTFISNILPLNNDNGFFDGLWAMGLTSNRLLYIYMEGFQSNSAFTVPFNQAVFVSVTYEITEMRNQSGNLQANLRLSMWDGTTWQHDERTVLGDPRKLRLQGMQLGTSVNSESSQFDGVVDDFRIYNRTLTQQDLDFLAMRNGRTDAVVTAITSSPTSANSVQFQVDFTDDVTGFDAADLVITSDPDLTPGVAVITGSGKSYMVTIPVSGIGNISLDLNTGPIVQTIHGGGLLSSTPSSAIAVANTTFFALWAANSGLTSGVNDAPLDDSNRDGISNIEHFAFDTNPLGPGANEGKQRVAVNFVDGGNYLTLTLPVRVGATFTGSPSPTATINGITYEVEGSSNLQSPWDLALVEVTPPLASGLPVLRDLNSDSTADWEYRTFRLTTSMDQAKRGFFRVNVSTLP